MATCDCCHKNQGTVREWEELAIGSLQDPELQKRIPRTTLCGPCSDGQFPYMDDRGIRVCPHGI